MCKSKAQGGQRCSGHARDGMEAAYAALQAAEEDAHGSDTASLDRARAAEARYHRAAVEYASTPEGAAVMRAALTDPASVPEDLQNLTETETRRLIDQGAELAQANRDRENAWRAEQGKPPVNAPVPLTFAQEQEIAWVRQQAEAARAAWAADPLGLRTEQAGGKSFGMDAEDENPNERILRAVREVDAWEARGAQEAREAYLRDMPRQAYMGERVGLSDPTPAETARARGASFGMEAEIDLPGPHGTVPHIPVVGAFLGAGDPAPVSPRTYQPHTEDAAAAARRDGWSLAAENADDAPPRKRGWRERLGFSGSGWMGYPPEGRGGSGGRMARWTGKVGIFG